MRKYTEHAFPGAWQRAEAQEVALFVRKLFLGSAPLRAGGGPKRLKHIPAARVREDPPQETAKQLSSG